MSVIFSPSQYALKPPPTSEGAVLTSMGYHTNVNVAVGGAASPSHLCPSMPAAHSHPSTGSAESLTANMPKSITPLEPLSDPGTHFYIVAVSCAMGIFNCLWAHMVPLIANYPSAMCCTFCTLEEASAWYWAKMSEFNNEHCLIHAAIKGKISQNSSETCKLCPNTLREVSIYALTREHSKDFLANSTCHTKLTKPKCRRLMLPDTSLAETLDPYNYVSWSLPPAMPIAGKKIASNHIIHTTNISPVPTGTSTGTQDFSDTCYMI
ncbi:hypothetical protein BC834DRAFT_847556 [Gloeopeniophorella convolvens]|nr:hypothetical protein BC834DRAFT_847556 [Gloeopeniophorella convolvens]